MGRTLEMGTDFWDRNGLDFGMVPLINTIVIRGSGAQFAMFGLRLSPLSQVNGIAQALHDFVAFANTLLQTLTVEDFYGSAGIGDGLLPLEKAGCQADAGAVGAQHAGEEIVGNAERILLGAIVHGQQPAS
jgi:hypothetical protein